MTIQFPVHPDDVEMLLKIRRYLIGHRITNGWTQHQLSQMINDSAGTVYSLESDDSWQWRLSRLQKWVMPFGLRLEAKVFLRSVALTKQIHADPEVAPLWQLSRRDGTEWPMWQRTYLSSCLVVGRKKMGISSQQMARMAQVTRNAINNWERVADEMLLPKVLGYARVLDGHIRFGLGNSDGTIL